MSLVAIANVGGVTNVQNECAMLHRERKALYIARERIRSRSQASLAEGGCQVNGCDQLCGWRPDAPVSRVSRNLPMSIDK